MLQARTGALGINQPLPVDEADEQDGIPRPRRYWSIAAISFGTALLVIDGAIANVALPTIARDLDVSNGVVTNVVTVYQLVLVMVLLPFSSFGDKIGHRRLYQWGQMVFMAASAACLLANTFAVLMVLRALQALGAGMALSVSAAMLRQTYPARSLGTGMGINSVIVASSAAIAPTLGGYIVGHLAWQWVFVAAAPLAIVSLLLGRSLPDPVPQRDKPSEVVSGVWSAASMLFLIGGIQLATHDNFAMGLAIFVGGVVSMILLVRRERSRTAPVVPVDLLAKPVLGLSALAAVASFIASAALMLSLPFRLEEVFGFAPQKVGLLLLPFPLTLLVVAPLAGWMSDRIAATKLGVTGMAIAIVGLLLLAVMPTSAGETGIAWRLALAAIGFGLFFAPNSRLLIGRAPKARAAAAGGLLSTSRLVGQALGAVVLGILLAGGLGTGPAPLYVACALAVVAAACSLARFAQRDNPANA
ncbi:MFS transporter [Aurantiacibacter spongiae]|uniref:MFS transporter n=1 Tax=Aurantiacibacter spongiae TaxID=2488860 RepID=A0A3N5CW38_9SPHN|nr:MFS transporter [Aurantiacibacter spongiae]RPF72526.1 MFS transporter [Aurantiacibacter spongiae]